MYNEGHPPPFWRCNQCRDLSGPHDTQCFMHTVQKNETKATCFCFPQHSNMPCPNIRNSRWPTAISQIYLSLVLDAEIYQLDV